MLGAFSQRILKFLVTLNCKFTCTPNAFFPPNFQYRWQQVVEEYYRSTHLTPTIWTFSSLAHSMRWRQFFRVVPNFRVISSSPFMSSVAIWSKSLREGEDDWGTVGLQQHQHMWSLKTVRSMLIMLSLLQFCRRTSHVNLIKTILYREKTTN